MFPYISLTETEKREMLEKIGLETMDDLFKDIPEDVSLNRSLDLPTAKSELEVTTYLQNLANKNVTSSEKVSFLGAGAYDHYIPSIIKHITGRSEFYTSYTPYQPEISQGTLQYIFEYQTLISRLTGMEIANASLYDGGTAMTEAALMACHANKKKNIVISKTVSDQARCILDNYAHAQGLNVIEVEEKEGMTDFDLLKETLSDEIGAVVVQSPNKYGFLEDLKKASEITHGIAKNSIVAMVDPLSCAVLKKPGSLGVDVVVGEAQSMGIPVAFGGPYIGFIAVNKPFLRKLPGRLVGQTEDLDGKRSWVLTLSAREQHIRRDKATSNICSNQGLNALATAVYMTTMGKQGMKEVAEHCIKKSHYALAELVKTGKFKALSDAPFFKEFTVITQADPKEINRHLSENGIIGGYIQTEMQNAITIAVTEKRTKEEIDRLVKLMAEV